jgi:hypothetical protein
MYFAIDSMLFDSKVVLEVTFDFGMVKQWEKKEENDIFLT